MSIRIQRPMSNHVEISKEPMSNVKKLNVKYQNCVCQGPSSDISFNPVKLKKQMGVSSNVILRTRHSLVFPY